MDRANLTELEAWPRDASSARLGLFLEFAPGCGSDEVPDPYYGGQRRISSACSICARQARADC